MSTTFEISEPIVVEARIEPASDYSLYVDGWHGHPSEDQMRSAASQQAQALQKDLEDLGYGVRIYRALREPDDIRRHMEEERQARALLDDVEQGKEDLRRWRSELDALAERGRRLEYRARVGRFKSHQAARLLRG